MLDSIQEFVKQNAFLTVLGVMVVLSKTFSWVGKKYWNGISELVDKKDSFVTQIELQKCRDKAMEEITRVVEKFSHDMTDRLNMHQEQSDINRDEIARLLRDFDNRNEERITSVHSRIDALMQSKFGDKG